jgi:hypothetical protein
VGSAPLLGVHATLPPPPPDLQPPPSSCAGARPERPAQRRKRGEADGEKAFDALLAGYRSRLFSDVTVAAGGGAGAKQPGVTSWFD